MRKITKKARLESLERFKADFLAREGRQPQYDDLRGEEYHKVKCDLIEEQFALCCYCGKRIHDYDAHIEHFVPQSADDTKTLAYDNMLASCNGYRDRQENCGHKKDNWYDANTVSPMEEDCESHFTYSVDGKIDAPPDDERGRQTIRHLELDSTLLNRARRSAIYISGLFDEDFDAQKKEELLKAFRTPTDGELPPFCVAICYCIEHAKV